MEAFHQKYQAPPTAHILIFPLPIQGPVNSMLKLAELISIASSGDMHITFLTTEHVYRRLLLGAAARFERCPRFSFRPFPDGLPEDHPRGSHKFMEMLDAVEGVSRPILREMLTASGNNNSSEPPVSCFIADGLFSFALDVGKEAKVPVIYFDTISPACLWVYFCLPRLFQTGEIPFTENDDLEGLISLPGMGSILRRRDLPEFCRANNPLTNFMSKRVPDQANQFRKAQGVILNTFEDLEAPLLSSIRSYCQNVYVIGPLHLHLKEIVMQNNETMSRLSNSYYTNSLFLEDKDCMQWLDQQAPHSVVFCSFGSQVVITKDQLMEFWYGLVNSGTRFLWILRPGSILGMDGDVDHNWHCKVPKDLAKGIEDYGFVSSWVPQEEVLSHLSVGCFLTHCGWNSTMESIVAGMPMICWPNSVDQLVNSRYVSEVWRVGVDMKDTCNRVIIEKMVRDVMKCRRDVFSTEADKLAKLAKHSVSKDGPSYCSLDKLVDDIKSFKLLVSES